MIFNEEMVLPYYKIERTKEENEFFNSNIGYFNFWDTYLIIKTSECEDTYGVLVNRDSKEFGSGKLTDKQKVSIYNSLADSVYFQKPEQMFKDFHELKKFDFLKNHSVYSICEVGSFC